MKIKSFLWFLLSQIFPNAIYFCPFCRIRFVRVFYMFYIQHVIRGLPYSLSKTINFLNGVKWSKYCSFYWLKQCSFLFGVDICLSIFFFYFSHLPGMINRRWCWPMWMEELKFWVLGTLFVISLYVHVHLW